MKTSMLLLVLPMVLCILMPADSALAANGPEVSAQHLDAIGKRLDEISKVNVDSVAAFQAALEKLRNREADAELLYQKQLAKADLACHRELLMLARDLSILGGRSSDVKAGGDGEAAVPAKVAGLRNEIDVMERARIGKTLASQRGMISDERMEKAIYRKELSLDSLFDRESSRPLRDIETARRAIAREKKQRSPDAGRIKDLEKQIEEAGLKVDQLVPLYYGHPARAGFDYASGWPPEHPVEVLRLKIIKSAGEIAARIAGHSKAGGENGGAYGEIGGTSIYSANLGVVLDISGSMTTFIEPLKKEIAASFTGPRYKEVIGCSLGLSSRMAGSPMVAVDRDTLAVIEELITVHKVDTVYWFCDLQDSRSVAALRRLRHLLRLGGVAFHVKSVDRSPDRELEPLITSFKR